MSGYCNFVDVIITGCSPLSSVYLEQIHCILDQGQSSLECSQHRLELYRDKLSNSSELPTKLGQIINSRVATCNELLPLSLDGNVKKFTDIQH